MKQGAKSRDASQTSHSLGISDKKAGQDEKVPAWIRQRGDLNRRGHNPRHAEQDESESH